MYKVSVVITTHNRLPMLKQAIDCVKKQTYSSIELNIVNDNSSDGTREYLENLKDESINVQQLYGSESKGGNHARNVGVEISSGELIAFLDDDDIWDARKIEKQVEMFEKDCEIGLVYCGYERITDNQLSTKVPPNKKYRGNVGLAVFSNIFSITSCLMIKKSLLKKIDGFDEQLSHWQEYDLLVRVSQVSKIDYVDECLVKIGVTRTDKKRLSNQVDKWKKSVEYFNRKHEKLIRQLSDKELNQKEVIFYLDGASRYAAIGNKKMHRQYMKIVWKKTKKCIILLDICLISIIFRLKKLEDFYKIMMLILKK